MGVFRAAGLPTWRSPDPQFRALSSFGLESVAVALQLMAPRIAIRILIWYIVYGIEYIWYMVCNIQG